MSAGPAGGHGPAAGPDATSGGPDVAPPAPAPGPERAANLRRLAVATLDGNWEHDHTVPSRTLYPHQWSWDSAFIAVGLAHVRPDRAWRELRTLFAAQWADGRVPHIVFNPALRVGVVLPGAGVLGLGPRRRRPDRRHLRHRPTAGARPGGVADPPPGPVGGLGTGPALALPAAGRPAAVPDRPAGRGRRRAGLPSCTRGSRGWTTARPGTPRWRQCPPTPTSCGRTGGTTPRTPTPRTAPRTWTTRATSRSSRPTERAATATTGSPAGIPSWWNARCSTRRSGWPSTRWPGSPRWSARTPGRTAPGRPGSPRPWWTGCTTRTPAPSTRATCAPTG